MLKLSLLMLLGIISACSIPELSADIDDVDNSTYALATHIALNWPLLSSTEASALRVRGVGSHLTEAVSRYNRQSSLPQWRFTVVRDQAITVFSIDGGRIYLSDGAVQACHDESELAALIAHEMAHQIARHFQTFAISHDAIEVTTSIGPQEIDPSKEREADRISISLLKKAGYDHWGTLRIAKRVLAQVNNIEDRYWHEQRIIHLENWLKSTQN